MFYWTHPEAPRDPTSDAPDPGGPRGVYYRCLDCDWAGRSALAFDHHCDHRGHRIILRDAPQWGPVAFKCRAPYAGDK